MCSCPLCIASGAAVSMSRQMRTSTPSVRLRMRWCTFGGSGCGSAFRRCAINAFYAVVRDGLPFTRRAVACASQFSMPAYFRSIAETQPIKCRD
jgi:hypothetical protein